MRLAVISDVHGNALALDAVLADIVGRGVDATFCLGDHVSGPMDSAGAVERLMVLGGPVIAGNHDRWVVEPPVAGQGAVDHFAAGQLSNKQRGWLPATAVFNNEVFLCHGTPASDEQNWIDGWYVGRTATLPDEKSIMLAAEGVDYPSCCVAIPIWPVRCDCGTGVGPLIRVPWGFSLCMVFPMHTMP
ncbi:MAG: metallophosphatase family protein [Candidatus Devosia euplotis]|nr:metallophosphatase family protein [Candidatus Devosia euplotis]